MTMKDGATIITTMIDEDDDGRDGIGEGADENGLRADDANGTADSGQR